MWWEFLDSHQKINSRFIKIGITLNIHVANNKCGQVFLIILAFFRSVSSEEAELHLRHFDVQYKFACGPLYLISIRESVIDQHLGAEAYLPVLTVQIFELVFVEALLRDELSWHQQ